MAAYIFMTHVACQIWLASTNLSNASTLIHLKCFSTIIITSRIGHHARSESLQVLSPSKRLSVDKANQAFYNTCI